MFIKSDGTKVNTETSTKIILKEIAPNFHYISFSKSDLGTNEKTILYFSYETLIGFTHNGETYCIENEFSKTTAKHIKYVEEDKEKRLSGLEFRKAVKKFLNICIE